MDTELLKLFLKEEYGFQIVHQFESAEVIIILGCSVTQHMEEESLDIMNYFKLHANSRVRVFVLGCVTKIKPSLNNSGISNYLPINEIESLFRMDENAKNYAIN